MTSCSYGTMARLSGLARSASKWQRWSLNSQQDMEHELLDTPAQCHMQAVKRCSTLPSESSSEADEKAPAVQLVVVKQHAAAEVAFLSWSPDCCSLAHLGADLLS